jgi:hypothetical protein
MIDELSQAPSGLQPDGEEVEWLKQRTKTGTMALAGSG